jgi:hypothetical protein
MLDLCWLVSQLREALEDHEDWHDILSAADAKPFAIHLAIFQEPYLEFIMDGRKTIETRFSRRMCAPFQAVSSGDVVILKRSGGEIVGICLVEDAWFYQLTSDALAFIRDKFGRAICAEDDSFWEERKEAAVVTLIAISHVTPLNKIDIPKRDRRGWVVLNRTEISA